MTKEDMMNRISFALQDHFLQMGFEVIRSKLSRLEKENAELKADNDARMFAMAMSEKVEKQLREENAELKKEVEKYKWNNIFLEDCAVYDKKIAEEYQEPEAQIEKMKCCQNCKHCTEIKRYKALGGKEISKICSDGNYVCDKWEIKE